VNTRDAHVYNTLLMMLRNQIVGMERLLTNVKRAGEVLRREPVVTDAVMEQMEALRDAADEEAHAVLSAGGEPVITEEAGFQVPDRGIYEVARRHEQRQAPPQEPAREP